MKTVAVLTAFSIMLALARLSNSPAARFPGAAKGGGLAAAEECAIEIGEGGNTYTYKRDLKPGEQWQWSSVEASGFIRRTSGTCHFTVFNNANFGGRHVTIGSNLRERIRAGIDGVRYKDEGGGDTWRIRSLRITRVRDTTCRLSIGGGGVRMDYYGPWDVVPAMDRIGGFFGGDCRAEIWSAENSGRDDPYNRFKSLHPSGARENAYDPGFRVRSISIRNEDGRCQEIVRDRGRCLPQHTLSATIYAVSNTDRDGDGLVDQLENSLAEAFRPIYVNDSGEDATRLRVYNATSGEWVMEPVTIFQVRPDSADQIVIVFMKLWLWDRGVLTCGGHKGDSQPISIYLRTTKQGSPDRGKFWYVYKTAGGIEGDLDWEQGDGSIRGATFEKWGSELSAKHLVIYFSKDKHHEYADGGWSGQTDKACPVNAYVNGSNRSYPKRIAIIRSPRGKGDNYDYTNVGSQRVHFFDDLAPYGFADQRVWSGKNFYEAAGAVDRSFK